MPPELNGPGRCRLYEGYPVHMGRVDHQVVRHGITETDDGADRHVVDLARAHATREPYGPAFPINSDRIRASERIGPQHARYDEVRLVDESLLRTGRPTPGIHLILVQPTI